MNKRSRARDPVTTSRARPIYACRVDRETVTRVRGESVRAESETIVPMKTLGLGVSWRAVTRSLDTGESRHCGVLTWILVFSYLLERLGRGTSSLLLTNKGSRVLTSIFVSLNGNYGRVRDEAVSAAGGTGASA